MHLPKKLQIPDLPVDKEHKQIRNETVSLPSTIQRHLVNILYVPFSVAIDVNIQSVNDRKYKKTTTKKKKRPKTPNLLSMLPFLPLLVKLNCAQVWNNQVERSEVSYIYNISLSL